MIVVLAVPYKIITLCFGKVKNCEGRRVDDPTYDLSHPYGRGSDRTTAQEQWHTMAQCSFLEAEDGEDQAGEVGVAVCHI